MLGLCLLPGSLPGSCPRCAPGHFLSRAARLESTFAEINFKNFSILRFILSQEVSSKGDELLPLSSLPLCPFHLPDVSSGTRLSPLRQTFSIPLKKKSVTFILSLRIIAFGVRSLGQEDPLEQETAPTSSIFAWKVPWAEEPGGLQVPGAAESLRRLSTHTHMFAFQWCVHFCCTRQ